MAITVIFGVVRAFGLPNDPRGSVVRISSGHGSMVAIRSSHQGLDRKLKTVSSRAKEARRAPHPTPQVPGPVEIHRSVRAIEHLAMRLASDGIASDLVACDGRMHLVIARHRLSRSSKCTV